MKAFRLFWHPGKSCSLLLLVFINGFVAVPGAEAACPASFSAIAGERVQLVSCTEAVSGNGNFTSATVPVPAAVGVGDFLMAVVSLDDVETFGGAPAGWTFVGSAISTDNSNTLGMYSRISTGVEPASYAFTWGGGQQYYAYMLRFTGASGLFSFEVTEGEDDGTPPAPSVTTLSDNNLILRIAGYDRNSINIDPATIIDLHNNITQDRSSQTGQSSSGAAAYTYLADAGASGSADFSMTASNVGFVTASFGIEPIEFVFQHSGTASTCGSELVTVAAVDRNGAPIPWFNGTVTLSTSTGNGDWYDPGGLGGTLNNSGGGDASYTFVPGDGGVAVLEYHNPNAEVVNFDLAWGNFVEQPDSDADLTIDDQCEFQISHDGNAGTCGMEEITISLVDSAGQPATFYTGTIDLDTSTGDGAWSLNAGAGGFSDPPPDDGSASYTFDPSDDGQVVLGFLHETAATVNFGVSDALNPGYVVDGAANPDLIVADCTFRFSHSGNSDVCSVAAITLSVVDSVGGAITGYAGTVSLTSDAGAGNWSSIDGAGVLTPDGGGSATYVFDPADGGDVELGYNLNSPATVNFGATATGVATPVAPFDDDLVIGNCFAEIQVNPTANVCSSEGETLTLTIVNSLGAVATDFTGLITLSTSTANGDYVSTTGSGNLDNGTEEDGVATYEFDAGDNGTVNISFTDDVEETLDFSALATHISFDAGESNETLQMLGCEFRIAHGGSSDVCSAAAVTVSVFNSNDEAVVDYTGTVNLETSTDKGGWTLNAGNGDLDDPSETDGSATYEFDLLDAGVVVLDLTYPDDELVNIDVFDGVSTDPGNSADPDDQNLNVLACTFRITMVDGVMTGCTSEEVTFTIYNSNNAIATDYTGTMTVSTDSITGTWTLSSGIGLLNENIADDNGAASYTFDASDNGSVVFDFYNPHLDTVNFDAVDGSIMVDSNFDPSVSVTGCAAGTGNFVCENGPQNANLTISGEHALPTLRGRMVVMWIFHLGTEDVSVSPTFAGQDMTLIHKVQNSVGTGTSVELWGITDALLPDLGGSYTGSYTFDSAPGNDPSMCLVELEDVEQSLPAYNGATPNQGQVNGSLAINPGNGDMATTIATTGNNALVISGAVSDYTAGTTYFNGVSPDPPMSPLLGDTNHDANPENGTAGGSAGVNSVAGTFTVTDIDNQVAPNGWAHIVASFDPLVQGLPQVSGYEPVLLFQTMSGNLSYRAVGAPLRRTSNANPDGGAGATGCQFVPEGTGSSTSLTLPPGSNVLAAHLYWGGSGSEGEADANVTFGPTGSEINVTADSMFLIEGVGGAGDLDYFAGYKDVTAQVSAAEEDYTFRNLTVQTDDWSATQACAGGWALIAVFEHESERLRVINLFHGFQPFQNSSFVLVPRNFRMATTDNAFLPNGQVTHITIEGDETLATGDESLGLQNVPGGEIFDALLTSFNPLTAEFNSTITRPIYAIDGGTGFYEFQNNAGINFDGYEIDFPGDDALEAGRTGDEIGESWGLDVDTHYITGATASDPLFPFAQPGSEAEEITTRYSAGQDLVMLISEVISVTNYPIADFEVFMTQGGPLKVNGTGSYLIEVQNNGNGALSGGFANGEVIVGDILPTGLTLDSVAGDGWVCSNTTVNAFTCAFDIAASCAAAQGCVTQTGELWAGESLPTITANVSIAGSDTFPLEVNNVKNVVRMVHTGGSCGALDAGVIPVESNCTRSPQFDNVYDLQGGAVDINDLDDKQVVNNNVSSIISPVTGIQTDLSIQKSVNGIFEVGGTGSYTLTVTNNGPDATTAVITVTDPQPARIAFDSAGGVGWNCTLGPFNCEYAGSLGSGDSASITLNVDVTGSAGQNVTNTATVTAGPFNFDVAGNNSDTEITQIVAEPVASQERFLMSVSVPANSTQIGGLSAFENHDYIVYNPQTDNGTMFYDNSDLGFNVNDADAVHLFKNGHIAISASSASDVGSNSLSFQPEDIVVYDPILGTAEMLFDGSAVFDGPVTADHNVDAVYVRDDGRILFSTEGPASITFAGPTTVSWNQGDIVEYNPEDGSATILVDASDANIFGGEVQVDGLYLRVEDNDPNATKDIYVLSVGETSATLGACGSCDPVGGTTLTHDDVVELDLTGPDPVTQNLFVGDLPLGVFSPADADRRIDALHVAEDGYVGHFAISQAQAGSTCTAGEIRIRKHMGLSHDTDIDYYGSVIISTDTGTGDWGVADGVGNLDNLTPDDGVAIYTFDELDEGEVTLYLTEDSPGTVNVDVTNGFRTELGSEDPNFTFNEVITEVTFRDEFSQDAFDNNDGSTLWAGDWIEGDGVAAGVDSGNVTIESGSARFTTTSTQSLASLSRVADLSTFIATEDVMLEFDFSYQSLNEGSDVFVAEARPSDGAAFTQVWSFSLGGSNLTPQHVTLNLTTLLASPEFTDTTEIRFRITNGYTGTSRMYIDNVELSTGTNDCGIGFFHHYEISIEGMTGTSALLVDGIACVGSVITITGHDANHFPSASDELVTLQTSTGQGSWATVLVGGGALNDGLPLDDGMATYDFPLGETTASFRFNYTGPATDPELVNFNLATAYGVALSEDPTLAVNQAGLLFFDETNQSSLGPIPMQIAGKNSNVAPLDRLLTIEAVRTADENPLACSPLFDAGNTLTIEFGLECQDPGVCQAQPGSINGEAVAVTDDNAGTGATAYTPVDILFTTQPNSGHPAGSIVLNYADVGQMQLHAEYEIPLNDDPLGTLSGNYLRGSSNAFIVRPFGFDIDFSGDRSLNGIGGDSYADDADDSSFWTAGLAFDTTVSAIAWEPLDDMDNDGIPDVGANLSDNAVTPNYGNESTATDYDVLISLDSIVAPADGVGDLGDNLFPLFSNGSQTKSLVFSEVGIIDLTAELVDSADGMTPAGFMGTGVGLYGNVRNVGRFVPSWFDITGASIVSRPLADMRALCIAPSSFTYVGEEFGLSATVTAKNENGDTTRNYVNGFAKLDSDELGLVQFYAIDEIAGPDDDFSSRLSLPNAGDNPDVTWNLDPGSDGGQGMLTGNLVFGRQADGSEDGPFENLRIALNTTDDDGVGFELDLDTDDVGGEDVAVIASEEFRYGRLLIDNSFGPETEPLDLMFQIQFWDGGNFLVNTDDGCTTLFQEVDSPPGALDFVAGSYLDNLGAGETTLEVDAINDVEISLFEGRNAALADEPNLGDDRPFVTSAPGLGNDGSVLIEFDLENASLPFSLGFLSYDWRTDSDGPLDPDVEDGNYDDNPRSQVRFGSYRGHDRIINWQEIYVGD
ncbi:MAG: DUF11 domain-containing protein [Pseudohongiellaceae bacterium]